MHFFPSAHATGAQWSDSAAQVMLQLRAQLQMQPDFVPRLGLLYIAQAWVPHAQAILEFIAQGLPEVSHWCGAAGGALLGGDVNYAATPAIGGFLVQAQPEDFYVFSGLSPLSRAPQGFEPTLALVHADEHLCDADALLAEVAASTRSGHVLGGLTALQLVWRSGADGAQPVQGSAGVWSGGISGVALRGGAWLQLQSVPGYRPVGGAWRVTRVQRNVVLELDGRQALPLLLRTLGLPPQLHPLAFAAVTHDTWLGLSSTPEATPQWQRLSGLDVAQRGLVLPTALEREALYLQVGVTDLHMANSELRRLCAHTMDALTHSAHDGLGDANSAGEPRSVAGVLVVRSGMCTAQDAAEGMQLDAQLQLIRHAFGPVPVLGWDVAQAVTAHGLQPAGLQLLVFTQTLQWPRWT